VDASGNWFTQSNWDPRVPKDAGDRAIFGSIITAPRTVTLNSPVTVGHISFASSHAYTIAPSDNGDHGIKLDVKSGDSLIQVSGGSHVISAPVRLDDDTVITVIGPGSKLTITRPLAERRVNLTKAGDGTLAVKGIRAESLAVNGGTLVLDVRGSADRTGPTSVVSALTIAGNPRAPIATLDVAAGAVVVDYLPASSNPTADIRQWILAGRGGPGLGQSWKGTGITSSQVQSDVARDPNSTSLGYADNVALPLGSFDRFADEPVDRTAVLIAYTRTGDANLDGIVNDDDVTILGANYAPGVPKPSWALGDFDYNGFVDDDDVTLLGALYDPKAPPLIAGASSGPGAVAAVPEPATVVLFAIMAAAWVITALRRRH
jgi:hypothetical protein